MESVFRVDKGTVGKSRVDDNGNLIVEGAITRTGVFTYVHRDKEGKTFTTHELRHPTDVFHPEAIKSFIQVPVTDDHPFEGKVTPDNVKKYSVGNLGDTITADGKFVRADLIIRDAKAIAKITAKEGGTPKRELSCGYRADVIEENGEYQGQRYDHRQTNIRGNHVAVVRAGRAGSDVRLMLDSADAVLYEDELDKNDQEDSDYDENTDGRRIGETRSGKHVYVGADDYDDDDWTVDDHQEATWMVKDEHRRVLEALNTIQRLGLGEETETALKDELEDLEACHKRHKRRGMTLDSKLDKDDPPVGSPPDRLVIMRDHTIN